MGTASTTAWVLHDLGLAAGFGGNLFGKLALNPAVRTVSSPEERGRVVDKAWNGFKVVEWVSLATIAGTWLVGRSFLSGRSVGRDVHRLVLTKDALIGAAVVTGIASSITGATLSQKREEKRAPILSGGKPSPETPKDVAALQRTVNVLGALNLGLVASVIGVTTILAFKAGKSAKWGALARLLP